MLNQILDKVLNTGTDICSILAEHCALLNSINNCMQTPELEVKQQAAYNSCLQAYQTICNPEQTSNTIGTVVSCVAVAAIMFQGVRYYRNRPRP